MSSKLLTFPRVLSLGMIAVVLVAVTAAAQVFDRTVDTESQINRSAAQAQQQIDQIADETEQLVDQYRRVVSEAESLRIYNSHLQSVVSDQEREIASIEQQLDTLEETSRDVVPLMLEMVDMYERLVEADMPIRLGDRRRRAQSLQDTMGQSNVTDSEKFRVVLEAYASEIELGHTAETYRGELPGQDIQVDFLRIGRTLLYYQTLDGRTTGWYNPNTRQFEELGDRYRQPVRDGLAIVRNEVAPDLVRLRVPAPESAQ